MWKRANARDVPVKVICVLLSSTLFLFIFCLLHTNTNTPSTLSLSLPTCFKTLRTNLFFSFTSSLSDFSPLLRLYPSTLSKNEEINSELFLSHLHCIGCCSRPNEKKTSTTRTLMVPHCDEEEGTTENI